MPAISALDSIPKVKFHEPELNLPGRLPGLLSRNRKMGTQSIFPIFLAELKYTKIGVEQKRLIKQRLYCLTGI